MTPDKAQSLANDISCVIATLQAIADDLLTAYQDSDGNHGDSREIPKQPPKPEPLTLEKVRGVLAEKSRGGYTAEVRALLEKHGAAKLSDIDPKAYPALLADAEVLGNG